MHTRRPRVLTVCLLMLATIWAHAMAAPSVQGVGPRRPDIIVIVTDDQRRGTLTWLPTVQRAIVRRGVTFTKAMVPTSLCCPSRASLLTGGYAHTTKIWSNLKGWRRFVAAGQETKTVAVWLRRSGYRTGLIGKYLNAYDGTDPPPGWRVWHAFLGPNADYYDYRLLHTDGSIDRYGSRPRAYSTDVLRRYAVRFLRSSPRTKPLFLYFAPYAPHAPATPPPRHASLPAPIGTFDPPSFNEADVSDKPAWIRRLPLVHPAGLQVFRVLQYRSLRAVDDAVSSIVEAQRARRRLRNTLLVFLSDNGLQWGEHRATEKFLPYSGATRIPMAMAWPARLPAGTRDGRLALNIDVPATIAVAARASHDDVAGRSLFRRWPRGGFPLEASPGRVPSPNGTDVQRPAYCGWRSHRFLFVHYANGREELYDYGRDRWELRDVHRLARYQDRKRDLRRHAREACDPVPPAFSWG